MYTDGYGRGDRKRKKQTKNRAHPFRRAGVYLNEQACGWTGTELSGDGEVHAECQHACVTAEWTPAKAGNIICSSEAAWRAGPVVIRPETANTTAVFVQAKKKEKVKRRRAASWIDKQKLVSPSLMQSSNSRSGLLCHLQTVAAF